MFRDKAEQLAWRYDIEDESFITDLYYLLQEVYEEGKNDSKKELKEEQFFKNILDPNKMINDYDL